MSEIKWVKNSIPKTEDKYLKLMSKDNIEISYKFHKSFPEYNATPLIRLKKMAEYLGIGELLVKDESYRFGLNAFKVLGSSFAIGKYISKEIGKDILEVDYNFLTSQKLKDEFGQVTFFTATDGNHGRGVAWAANKLGQKSVVRMPKGTVKARLENIKKENAEVSIEDLNYDDCVRLVAKEAKMSKRGVVIQDTAWEGYEEIPGWIMQGYGTMAKEAYEQMKELEINRPSHIFIQAGVGSLAGAVVGYFANLFYDDPPIFIVMEAQAADCLYQSAIKADGEIHTVKGDLSTIMAGLACGEPNTISWDILRNHVDLFVSCPDWVAAKGMRMLGAPLKGDKQIISGESGAIGMGLISTIMSDEKYLSFRKEAKLNKDSKVLIFSTEGDTDPVNYRNVVWNGAYSYLSTK
ncbi:diaminopropionate ammonia-lyase [Defluviitalea phaphyphila]|uniref:diaminopropionate ammonia-lyase n=1 Tax=Defluviitalea phaphyphila TaxID=1473580 RepID=UPI000730ECAA|nr:diaminopropionate ammonia-lyase [Defluviitalea phaphyphila]